jgi:MCRA family
VYDACALTLTAGDFVPKRMYECTGAEILREVLRELRFDKQLDAIMASSMCIQCDLPCVNNIWMPRKGSDRPRPVAEGATNLGLIGQYVEVPSPTGSTKPFVEDLKRYGLLPDPARNDGLPVGLTVSFNPFTFGMDFVGISCAACHVGELHHHGKAVRVDGAPNMFNLQLFYSDAIAAVLAATSDRGKLWRALKRLGRQDYGRYGIGAPFVRPATLVYYGTNVDARLELLAVVSAAKQQHDPEHSTSGFGRLDAFDGTRNFIFTRLRKADAGEVSRSTGRTWSSSMRL